MQFLDKALARRLESAEKMPQVEFAQLYRQVRPEIRAAVEPICGGHMIFAGLNAPIDAPAFDREPQTGRALLQGWPEDTRPAALCGPLEVGDTGPVGCSAQPCAEGVHASVVGNGAGKGPKRSSQRPTRKARPASRP